MKYYNKIDKDGLYAGVTSKKREGFSYTEVPVKPISDDEIAKFNFESNEWEYNFEKIPEIIDTPYFVVEYMPSELYTKVIRPQCGDVVLEKSEDISVLIPCYNKAEFIVDTVKSCINQTMKPTHIVILLMDDESIALKDELEAIDSIVICIPHERLNACASRTKLVNEYCPTEWFILLDGDDMLKEDFIEKAYKEEASVVFPKVQKVNYLGEIGSYENELEHINGFVGHPFGCIVGNLTSLMNKQVFNEIGLDEDLCNGGEDFDFILRLFAQKKYKVSQCTHTCYYYRYAGGISFRHEFYESHFKSVKKNLEFLHEEYVAVNGYNEFENDFYNNPTLETFAKGSKTTFDTLFNIKEEIINTKLNNSKIKQPLSEYSKEQFVYIGDKNINNFNYVNKTFDVLFLEELTKHNIFNDQIEMVINKDILSEIENVPAYEKLIYLLDNYSCFVQKDPVALIDNETLETKVRDINKVSGIFKQEIDLLDVGKKVYDGANDDKIIEVNFALHHECNLNCSYCCQGLDKKNLCTDDEIFENFDKALTYLENNLDKSKLYIRLLGGEPTIWSDELIIKIMERLKDYRKVGLFTNNTNKDSLWYKYDKIVTYTHIVDWKEHPEKLQMENIAKNQLTIIVVTHDELDDLERILRTTPFQKQISVQCCENSPDPNLNLTSEDIVRFDNLLEEFELYNSQTCPLGIIEFNCETMMGKACCKGRQSMSIEELVDVFNNGKLCTEEICKGCDIWELTKRTKNE